MLVLQFLVTIAMALIPNGVEISESEYPAVVKIVLENDSICTGTFVGSKTVVTAPECLLRGKPKYIFSQEKKNMIILTTPDHTSGVIKLTVSQDSKSTLEISAEPLQKNPQAIVVGYGADIDDPSWTDAFSVGSEIKRKGILHIEKIENEFLITSGHRRGGGSFDQTPRGKDVGTAEGDLGAPLIISGKIVGILVETKLNPNNKQRVISKFKLLNRSQ